ncbi:hypothetical protein [Paenibacillus arenilitoris]|uniref:Uncharacterized protein n=1 Tax=Paenibacillus arenilitoris TaxID=2772299 RepID=A0A927CMK7_9BACL|nr:hypothetical protein [Paenibacillus arenilitoris]MBD2870324.1 hypothetical protein [Paenibacillus arenilitoris]
MKLVALFFCMSGMAGFLENIIFFWLQSYEYYPQILENGYYDMTLGAYISQRFLVSTVAVSIAAFGLGVAPVLLLTAMFVGIELIFLAIGIYKLNWWNPAYTAIGLFLYFLMTKKWYDSLLWVSSRFIRFFTLFSMTYTLYTDIIAIPTLAGHYRFAVHWFDDPARNTVMVILIDCFIASFLVAVVCYCRLHWAIKASVPLAMWASYFVLIRLQLFTFTHVWDLLVFAASDVAVLLNCVYFERVLSSVRK